MRKPEEIATAFAPREALEGKTRFFLVGIGGAGMSALARMLKTRGYEVTGTDSTLSPEVERLRSEGIDVHVGHAAEPLEEFTRGTGFQPVGLQGLPAPDPESSAWKAEETHGPEGHATTAVILTDAIDLAKSPEVKAAKELDIPIFRRSQALGWLLKPFKVIAVTGTHGKTTTTGMTGSGLIAAGLDPLVVVGAAIPQWGGPVREGKGEWAVVEACEAYDAFHDLDPEIVVLTNLELDHIDYHGSWENLKGSVARFIRRLPEGGLLVYPGHDAGSVELQTENGFPAVETFAVAHWDAAAVDLALPGEHNRSNAAGALAAARHAGAAPEAAAAGIAEFTGAERRLQVLEEGEVTVIDDYAHHPTEIEASLKALRERGMAFQAMRIQGLPAPDPKNPAWKAGETHGLEGHATDGRLIVVYQPHLYSRTAPLIKEFAEALSHADVVVLTDIYPAREDPIPGVSSARIAEKVTKPVMYVPSRHLLPLKVAKMVQPGDVVVGMGAGNIAEFGPKLIAELKRSKGERKKIAVLYGGDSAEREVSILSGRAVHRALVAKGHDAYLLDATDLLLSKGNLAQFLGPDRPDLAFLAVHGTHAEDGAIQGLLELLHIPYTGSGIQASAIAMDKGLTKKVLEGAGIRTPMGRVLKSMDDTLDIPPPLVVKPNAQGSTVGLRFVEKGGDVCGALAYAFQYDESVVVEEWIRGMEISVPVLDDQALPPVEIAPASGTYDFESKYTPGATEEIVPARLPKAVLEQAKAIALKAHRALGCAGATRTDMLVRTTSGDGAPEIFVLEVNTLPGMTSTSLLPNSAQAVGISFEELCQRLVEDALRRDAAKA
jgi:D-alanine--D-alanine ligase